MLVSNKIKKAIEAEVKNQQSLLKILSNQEQNYDVDYKEQKEMIELSIEYYTQILSEKA